jgi:hypothetical protein
MGLLFVRFAVAAAALVLDLLHDKEQLAESLPSIMPGHQG